MTHISYNMFCVICHSYTLILDRQLLIHGSITYCFLWFVNLTCQCFLHNVPLRLYWRVLLNYIYLFSDVMIILEYSHCISASCWLLVWRLHILAQIDNLIILVGALIFLLTLIAQCDSLLFSFRNLHLSWLSFGVVYCRTLRQLHITCRGFAWTIFFSWYSWW